VRAMNPWLRHSWTLVKPSNMWMKQSTSDDVIYLLLISLGYQPESVPARHPS
jgi:hypothetical protein